MKMNRIIRRVFTMLGLVVTIGLSAADNDKTVQPERSAYYVCEPIFLKATTANDLPTFKRVTVDKVMVSSISRKEGKSYVNLSLSRKLIRDIVQEKMKAREEDEKKGVSRVGEGTISIDSVRDSGPLPLGNLPPLSQYHDFVWMCVSPLENEVLNPEDQEGITISATPPDNPYAIQITYRFANDRPGHWEYYDNGLEHRHLFTLEVKEPEREEDRQALALFSSWVGALFCEERFTLYDMDMNNRITKAVGDATRIVREFPNSVYAPYAAVALLNCHLERKPLDAEIVAACREVAMGLEASCIKQELLKKLSEAFRRSGDAPEADRLAALASASTTPFHAPTLTGGRMRRRFIEELDRGLIGNWTGDDTVPGTAQETYKPKDGPLQVHFQGLDKLDQDVAGLIESYFQVLIRGDREGVDAFLHKSYRGLWGESKRKAMAYIKGTWKAPGNDGMFLILDSRRTAYYKPDDKGEPWNGDMVVVEYAAFDHSGNDGEDRQYKPCPENTCVMAVLRESGKAYVIHERMKAERKPDNHAAMANAWADGIAGKDVIVNDEGTGTMRGFDDISVDTQDGPVRVQSLFQESDGFPQDAEYVDWRTDVKSADYNSRDNRDCIVYGDLLIRHEGVYGSFRITMNFKYVPESESLTRSAYYLMTGYSVVRDEWVDLTPDQAMHLFRNTLTGPKVRLLNQRW